MARPINGDLLPVVSGFSNLGVNVSPNAQNAFDATEGAIRPFNHIHMVSGVYHDPVHGQSGVMRFNQAASAFQVSIDGGLTFQGVRTTASAGVDSIGILGGADLSGDVDVATPSSGFISIVDTGGASPLLWSVDHLALSGMWDFPTQGFNGSVVNSLTDFNGTTSQGAITVLGVSGIIVDIVGQTMTVGIGAGGGLATCYGETETAATTWVITHNFGTTDVSVTVQNASSPRVEIEPDGVEFTDANTVTITFNTAQAGRVIVIGCP